MVHHVCMQLAISCGMEIISPLCGICSTYKTLEFCLVVHLTTYNLSWLCLNHCITMTKLAGTGAANTLSQDLTKLCQQDKVCTKAHLRRPTLEFFLYMMHLLPSSNGFLLSFLDIGAPAYFPSFP